MGNVISQFFVDPKDLSGGVGGFVQLLYLAATYGYILCTASGWIGDGSELLLLIPSLAGIVGSVVLPVLGAVPDGAIVLFSGLGDDAQNQLNVGIGALAGSTVMLLTVPWALSIFAGRVSMTAEGQGRYRDRPKLQPEGAWSGTGVNCDNKIIGYGAKWMMLTSLTLVVVQVPAFTYRCGSKNEIERLDCDTSSERIFAAIGMGLGALGFAAYLYDQIRLGGGEEVPGMHEKVEMVQKKALESGQVSLRGLFGSGAEQVNPTDKNFRAVVRNTFHRYDVNSDGNIDATELGTLLRDLGEPHDHDTIKRLVREMDTDNSGTIDFEEFVIAMANVVNTGFVGPVSLQVQRSSAYSSGVGETVPDDDADEEEDEEEVPEDLAHLSPEEQRKRILQRACLWMFTGVAVVLLFSDPMVDVLSEVGNRIGVNPFYVSFVLCPLASNASEIIASYSYASKKTPKTMTVAFSALLGAATMNNTFCLFIFLVLIVAKKLVWEFSAETICILFAELCMYYVATRKYHRTSSGPIVLLLLPVSLGIVVLCEAIGLN
eukprot:PhM_4_TR522/c0_g1_i1/m.106322